MPLLRKIVPALAFGLLALLCSSCENYTSDREIVSKDSLYWSIRDYAADQFKTYFGLPYTLLRISHVEGQTDTTVVNSYSMDWGDILKTFLASDISQKKFVGQYDYAMTTDESLWLRTHTYTAKDPKLYTRLVSIATDASNNHVRSIYIETHKGDAWSSKSTKLLYIPLRMIQIQESSKSLFQKTRSFRIEYKEMPSGEEEESTVQ